MTNRPASDPAQSDIDATEPGTARASRSSRAVAQSNGAAAEPRATDEGTPLAPIASEATPPPSLFAAVAFAALAAQRAGAHTEHAALSSLETVLGEVRLRLGDARKALGGAHAGLLGRFDSIV